MVLLLIFIYFFTVLPQVRCIIRNIVRDWAAEVLHVDLLLFFF